MTLFVPRLHVNPNSIAFDTLIGDLSDIAVVTTPDEFNASLKIRLPDGSEA
jgi:hypothetical protein